MSILFVASPAAHAQFAKALEEKYPHLYNENLPYAGLFYGHVCSADSFEHVRIGGSEYGNELDMRFRAERSGTATGVRYNNRYDASGRGYSSGDGGRIHVELRPDDGTSKHLPRETVIAKTNSIVPANAGPFVTLTFASPVKIEAGKLYHVVFVQTTTRYGSTNGGRVYYPEDPIGGPYFGNDNLMFHRNQGLWCPSNTRRSGGQCVAGDYKLGQSYFGLVYNDGVEVGTGCWGYADNYPNIGGSNRIRQVFTVQGPTRRVNGVWFRMARRSGNNVGLTLQLKNAGGAVLLSRSVPASAVSVGAFMPTATLKWTYVDFQTVVPLQSGSKYFMVLSSPGSPSDGYTIHAYIDLHAYGYNQDRNMWRNAGAEISQNGGWTWTAKIENANNDFGFGFTLGGGPRSIQSIVKFGEGT